jgi:gliding motility-associated-like protein
MKKFTEQRFDEIMQEKLHDVGTNPPEIVLDRIRETLSWTAAPASVSFWKSKGFILSAVLSAVSTLGIVIFSFSSTTPSGDATIADLRSENQELRLADASDPVKSEAITIQNQETKQINDISSAETPEISFTIPVASDEHSEENNENVGTLKKKRSISVNAHCIASTCKEENGKAYLTSTGGEELSYYWLTIDPAVSFSQRTNLASGTYPVKAVNQQGDFIELTVVIKDSGVVNAHFTYQCMSQDLGMPVYFTNNTKIDQQSYQTDNQAEFHWIFGDGNDSFDDNPVHSFNNSGTYPVKLIAVSGVGCTDSSISNIIITGASAEYPNVFTPNGDGENDIFMPKVQALRSFHCTVFSRDGMKVFEWADPATGWNGRINSDSQDASPGIYYWIVEGVGLDGKIIQEKGFLQLNR